ncbi:MAG: GAF domain-containing protein [Anaerolineales bacterium]|nr:GAF domain-containing protein [Anaerolineales bacterium]
MALSGQLLFLGLCFLLLGGGCWLGAALFRRRPSSLRKSTAGEASAAEARMVVSPDGKILRADGLAKRWFSLSGTVPSLQSLAPPQSPETDFLRLAAMESRSVVRIRGRLYNVRSHRIGANGKSAMEIHFRPLPEPWQLLTAPAHNPVPGLLPAAFSSLDFPKTARTLLSNLLPISGADWCMIAIWDPIRQMLIPKSSLSGASLDPSLNLPRAGMRLGEGSSGLLARERRPLRISDLPKQLGPAAAPSAENGQFHSFLGFPLEVSGELLGTIEFYAVRPSAFSEDTLARIAPAAEMAALSLQNALVHENDVRREAEASALAQIAQTANLLTEPDAFFAELLRAASPLVDAPFFGFLIYDEARQALVPRRPFYGIPDHLLPMMHIAIPTGSPARIRWQTTDALAASGVDALALLTELGLLPLAQALGLVSTAILPLGPPGDAAGWLWAAAKAPEAIDEESLRRWTPLAAQAGRLIRSLLVLEKYRRASERSDFIRRLSALTASPPPLDEYLRQAINELAWMLSADTAVLFLLDESRDEIQLHPASAFGLREEDKRRFASFSTADPLSRHAVTFTGKPAVIRPAGDSGGPPPYYRPWVENCQIEHWIVSPLFVRGRGIGEILVGRKEGAFDSEEQEFLSAAAGQLAGTVEREQLFSATDTSLRRRVDQLTSLTRVSRELNTTIDLPYLLQLIFDEAVRVTGADCGRIALLDPKRSGYPLRPLFLLGEALAGNALSPLETEVLESGKPHLIRDLPSEPVKADHPGILSAILVPVIHEQHAVGLIDLHSRQPGWFDRASMEIVQAFGIQIAIAVGNAQRHEEQVQTDDALRRRARLLSTIHHTGKISLSHSPLPQRLETITQSIHDALGLTPVVIGSLRKDALEWHARSGLSDSAWQAVQAIRLSRETILRWVSARGDAEGPIPLGIPADDAEARRFRSEIAKEMEAQEILLLPLRTSGNELVGLLAASPPVGAKPGTDHSFLEIFASQATVAIQTDILQQALGEKLRPGKSAGQAAAFGPPQAGPASAESLDLQARLNRLLALVEVTEFLSTQAEPQSLFRTFAESILESYAFDIVLIAEERPGGPRLRLSAGKVPADTPVEMLLGQHNPILSMFQRGQPILALSLDDAPAWQNSALLTALKARSFLCFPIRARSKTEAVALIVSQEAATPFRAGDEDLFLLLGEQVAIYLENARLLEETQRRLHEGNVLLEFSRQVSGLDVPLILQSLVDETRNAVPEAEGAMVALWDRAQSKLAVQAVSGYANAGFLHRIACAEGEGLPGQTFSAGKPIHWAHVDMASDFNLTAENLEAYRNGTMGLIPASALGVPLQAAGRVLGILLLENFTTAEAFSHSKEEVALSLANQSALALEKARLFQEMTDRTRELDERASHLALLNRLTNAAITTSSERTLLQTACRELAAAFDVPQSAAVLIEPARAEAAVVAEHIYPGRPSAMSLSVPLRGSPLIETILQTRSPMHVENAPADPRTGALRAWLKERQVNSLLILPLLLSGDAAGLILIESPEPHVFSFADLSLAQTVSAQLGQALENVRLHQASHALTTDLEHRVVERTTALEREHQRAETLLRISTELVVSLDLDQVLTRALQLVNEAIGADQAAIVLLDPQTQQLVYRASLEKDSPLPRGGRSLPFHAGEGLAGWVIQQRQPVILPDLEKDPRWIHLYPDEPMRYHSALAVPLMVGADALGVLLLLSQDPSVFNPEQLQLASAAANQVAAAINNAELYRLIRDQADRLGGLVRSQQVESRKSRAMLEAIADGVMVTDEEQKIVLFNDAAVRLLNLPREQVIGRPAGEFIGLFGKAGLVWQERLHLWRSEPAEIGGGDFLAERITLDSGRVLSVHLAPVGNVDEFIGTVAVFRDITQEVEIDRLKSEFVATVSHELRTPMTAIRGYTEMLMMGAAGRLNDEQRRFLKIVKDNSDRLELLVSDLLDISRLESGQIRLNLDVVEIPALLEEAAELLRRKSAQEGKPMEIVLDLEPDLPAIQADRSRASEIFHNLAENAFLYTPAGGKITLRAASRPGGVRIDISDNGIGIAPSEHERIFERFYRGENPSVMAVPGTGLGLPITRRLVEMHGGSLTVESDGTPGKGTTFRVMLPRDAVQS